MANTNRRAFLKTSLGLSAATVATSAFGLATVSSFMSCSNTTQDGSKETTTGTPIQFEHAALPYAYDALEPHIDARTMEIHYSKHHAAYIKNANDAITEENITFSNAEDLFANMSSLSTKIRNNGGGAWNHDFFWKSLRAPQAGNKPSGALADAINSTFGSFDQFKEQFTAAGTGRFGSGWAWLVQDNGTLKIGSTPNQDNPLMDDAEIKGTPLLGIDVWEHAYYLHYQNKRGDYIANFWDIVNWDFVSSHYKAS
jgi:Fe-Mn family superoxide dismutase